MQGDYDKRCLAARWLQGLRLVYVAGICGVLLLLACGEERSDSQTRTSRLAVPASSQPTSAFVPIQLMDVTTIAGIQFHHEGGASGKKWYPETIGSGVGFFDYDGDGWEDLLFINGRRWPQEREMPEPTMQLYRNQGNGTFEDVTAESGLDVPLYGMGMAAADFDNDGDMDLLVTGYKETRLFRNEEHRTFTDITVQSGLMQGGWSTAAAFVDVDRDGHLDLLIGQYVVWQPDDEANLDCTYGTPEKDYCAVKFFPGEGLYLYRNQGSGRFQDVTVLSGVAAPEARVLGLTIVDDNQDGWPDILVSTDLTPSLFFLNQGDGTFQEVGVRSGLVLDEGGIAFAGMGIDATYINNNDQLCVAIGNFAGQPTTLHCQAPMDKAYRPDVFIEQSHRAGLARPTLRMVTFGLFFFDADLDGWQDLFAVNGHVVNEERLRNVPYMQFPQLFHNQRNGRFIEVSKVPETGLGFRLVGRGAAYADYDRDGDLDVVLTANQGRAYVLRNDTVRSGHVVRVMTRGRIGKSNRNGIGARARLYTNRRQLRAMVRTGGSYLSQSELTLTFGVQANEQVDRLEVSWPSGGLDVFRDLPLNNVFIAEEGEATSQPTMSQHIARDSSDTSNSVDPVILKRRAMDDYHAGKISEAITSMKSLLKVVPDDYIVQQYLVELYWREGSREQARTQLEKISQMFPDASLLTQFASNLEDNDLPELANEVYRTAANVDLQAPEALYRLGKYALEVEQYETALRNFKRALQRKEDLADAQHGIGLIYAAQGRTAEAEAQFRATIQQSPTFVEAYIHLGAIYMRTARLSEAREVYRTVIQLQPDRAQNHHNLGTVLAAEGQKAEAIERFQQALNLDPNLVAANNDLGAVYAEQGDLTRAITAFQAAIQSDRSSVEAHYNLAMAYGVQGEAEAMAKALQQTLKLDPQHVDAQLNLGINYLQSGRVAAAKAAFEAAIRVAPQHANAHYFRAVSAAQLGEIEMMEVSLQQVLRHNPNHARAHSALASLYFQQERYKLSWQYAIKAAQLGASVEELLAALKRMLGSNVRSGSEVDVGSD